MKKILIATDGFPLETFKNRPVINLLRKILHGDHYECFDCYHKKQVIDERALISNRIISLSKEIPEEWKDASQKTTSIPAPLMARIEYNRGVTDAFNLVVPKDYEGTCKEK